MVERSRVDLETTMEAVDGRRSGNRVVVGRRIGKHKMRSWGRDGAGLQDSLRTSRRIADCTAKRAEDGHNLESRVVEEGGNRLLVVLRVRRILCLDRSPVEVVRSVSRALCTLHRRVN